MLREWGGGGIKFSQFREIILSILLLLFLFVCVNCDNNKNKQVLDKISNENTIALPEAGRLYSSASWRKIYYLE
jgi:YbbR domain-containing protein